MYVLDRARPKFTCETFIVNQAFYGLSNFVRIISIDQQTILLMLNGFPDSPFSYGNHRGAAGIRFEWRESKWFQPRSI